MIHKMCDDKYIIDQSKEKVNIDIPKKQYILLTVANLRPEKNYLRQVEVMKELKDRGVNVLWLNVGSTANEFIHQQVKVLINKYGLENDFVLLGVDQNPYKYMSKVDAVTVLSDFESWSLVITESKLVGTPVIATKTSGALEQLIDRKTGIFTDFEINQIADGIQEFLLNNELQQKIRKNLIGFTTHQEVIKEFSSL